MANHLMLAGQYANHMGLLPAANITSSDADSLFPLSNLVGAKADEPWRPFRHATPAAADRNVTIDKNQTTANGGAEVGDTSGFTDGSVGASNGFSNVSTPVNSGSRAFSLTVVTTGGSNKAEMYMDIFVRAGEQISISVALRGDGTRVVRARAYIRERNEYLTSGSAWSTTPSDWATRTAATYATTTLTPTVPAYSAQVPGGVYTLRLIIYVDGTSAGTCFMDDLYFWHNTDTAAVIGHNVKPAITSFELRRDTAAFAGAGTVETGAFATVISPTMYALTVAMRTERYWRFRAVGTNPEALWYGSLFLGQKYTLTRNPNYGIVVETLKEQTRQASTSGAEKIYVKEDIERRAFTFPFSYRSAAQWQAARDRLFRQAGFGEFPILMIHDDSDTEAGALVRTPESFAFTHRFQNVRDAAAFPLVELAFPTFIG